MDVEFSSLAILLSSFTFIIMLLRLVITQSKNLSKSTWSLPPGPRKIPLIGNLHLFASFRPPHRTITDLAGKYGPVMHLQLGEVSTIVVSSPETAKEALKTHDINFGIRPSLLIPEIMCYGNTDIAFASYGDYWRQLRKICTLELLSNKRVQSFRPIREREISTLCRWIASKEGSAIDLTERIECTTYDILLRAALGKKTKEQDELLHIFREAIELVSGFHFADLYPSIKLFRKLSGMRSRIERLHKSTDRILGNAINDHKAANAARKNVDDSDYQEDLVDVLLKFNDAGHELHITTENIKAVLLDMFNAGTDTSSTTVDWAMAEMLKQPRILSKAQEEVRRVFDQKGYVDESCFNELMYLKLVIKETLRMHPPATLLLPRENSDACEIGGYKIPPRTRLIVNTWAVGRDPRHWKEPHTFMPERFLNSSVDFKGNNYEFIPFGAGRRICPGMIFGLANVEHPLAMLLYYFDWVLPNGMKPEQLDMEEAFGVTIRRKVPLHVIPVVKKPLPEIV